MPKAHKYANRQNFTVLTSQDVRGILNSKVQSNNGSAFKASVTQGVLKTLGIEYHTVPGDPNLWERLKKKKLMTLLRDFCIS